MLEATDLIADCALTGAVASGSSDDKYRRLLVLRTELGVLLARRDIGLLDLYEECVSCVLEGNRDLRAEAARSFSVGATRWAVADRKARSELKQYESELMKWRKSLG